MASIEFDLSFGEVQLNHGGIISTWKSGGMQAALAAQTVRLGAQADAQAASRNPRARYCHGVDVGAKTALGYVGTGNYASRIDEAYHHTLESLNH